MFDRFGFLTDDIFSNRPLPSLSIMNISSAPTNIIIKGLDIHFLICSLLNVILAADSLSTGIITSPSSPVGLQSI